MNSDNDNRIFNEIMDTVAPEEFSVVRKELGSSEKDGKNLALDEKNSRLGQDGSLMPDLLDGLYEDRDTQQSGAIFDTEVPDSIDDIGVEEDDSEEKNPKKNTGKKKKIHGNIKRKEGLGRNMTGGGSGIVGNIAKNAPYTMQGKAVKSKHKGETELDKNARKAGQNSHSLLNKLFADFIPDWWKKAWAAPQVRRDSKPHHRMPGGSTEHDELMKNSRKALEESKKRGLEARKRVEDQDRKNMEMFNKNKPKKDGLLSEKKAEREVAKGAIQGQGQSSDYRLGDSTTQNDVDKQPAGPYDVNKDTAKPEYVVEKAKESLTFGGPADHKHDNLTHDSQDLAAAVDAAMANRSSKSFSGEDLDSTLRAISHAHSRHSEAVTKGDKEDGELEMILREIIGRLSAEDLARLVREAEAINIPRSEIMSYAKPEQNEYLSSHPPYQLDGTQGYDEKPASSAFVYPDTQSLMANGNISSSVDDPIMTHIDAMVNQKPTQQKDYFNEFVGQLKQNKESQNTDSSFVGRTELEKQNAGRSI